MKQLINFGQIKKGDSITISGDFSSAPFTCKAELILNSGTDKEEVIYNRGKNHYFITSMVLDGTSRVKEVSINH